MTSASRGLPASTYRLQLHHGFTFQDARARLDYFATLGISHLYLSPVTMAAPGSLHGYDVVDSSRVNPELGGEDGLRALALAARDRGLGLILDIVPNHMSTAEDNWRWMDVLRHGQASRFAHWFDVDWDARDELAAHGKVLLPVLGDELAAVLDRGELTLEEDAGGRWLRYFERRFPVAPEPPAAGEDSLSALLERQHYILEYWLAAKSHVDYRRFFTVDELIGVRVEDTDVFAATHELFARLASDGLIDGARVDHADGLSDPAAYFARLRALLGEGAYVVAEKILAPGEHLPEDWPVDGATGYEFMADIAALQTDDAHRPAFDAVYREATGRPETYEDIAHACRLRVLDGTLAGQFRRTTRQLHRAIESPPPFEVLAAALRALVACLPVYRTYHSRDRLDPRAEEVVAAALRVAAVRHTEVERAALEAAAVILARPDQRARKSVMRLQQLMPAVAAKAVEDNVFYRYIPLLSLNEVGGDPVALHVDATGFHARNAERARRWPAAMLATATHDHKRGEDVRARLGALSEQPEEWRAFLGAFRAAAGPAPSPLEEYRAAQTLIGIWPPRDADAGDIADRLAAYLVKSAREAAERTSWDAPDEAYESELRAYAGVAVEAMRRLPAAQQEWRSRLNRDGIVNSLAQVLLRVLSPGVPDTYQGAELWDGSLVDPDNRRPVDYELRAGALARLAPLLTGSPEAGDLRREATGAFDLEDPTLKLYVLARALNVRRSLHPLCTEGEYLPLEVRGPHARHALAFARRLGREWLIAATVLCPTALRRAAGAPPDWAGAGIVLPHEFATPLADAFTGAGVAPTATNEGAMLPLNALFAALPVALLRPAAQ